MIQELEKFEGVVFRLERNIMMGNAGLNFDNLVPSGPLGWRSAKC